MRLQTGVRLSDAGKLVVMARCTYLLARDPLEAARWNPSTDLESPQDPLFFTAYLHALAFAARVSWDYWMGTSCVRWSCGRVKGVGRERGNLAVGWMMPFDDASVFPETMTLYVTCLAVYFDRIVMLWRTPISILATLIFL